MIIEMININMISMANMEIIYDFNHIFACI